ncbi:MAG: isopentenyl phosphate kinase [Anaerolineaceae bacterium]|jgi:isopentenyl phosphate kinase|nr:isopentenyl phosphate kinase [Anaerolineaceae bacterium]
MLTFLKLGGSLITDKDSPHTARPETLRRLADEIVAARQAHPDIQLVIGHGSGSFGHMPAKKYGTRDGVHTPEEWLGFQEVWQEARALNQIVMDILSQAGLPVVSFPPSASITAQNGQVKTWDTAPLRAALAANLIPLIYGDVIFDTIRGGTILSTEELFFHLTSVLSPQRILIAGIENGVWQDYPARRTLVKTINPSTFDEVAASLKGSQSVDVTGGMLAKVQNMVDLVSAHPGLEVLIFSGSLPGTLTQALNGQNPGTCISNQSS